jgi:hypothetical protein
MAPHDQKDRLGRSALAISWMVIAVTVAALIFFIMTNVKYEISIYITSLAIYIFVQFILNRLRWIRNPPAMQIFISFVVLVGMTIGRFFGFYNNLPGFDKAMHLLYGIAFCIIGFVLFYRMNPAQREKLTVRPAFLLIYGVCFAITCSFFWEVYEFVLDRILNTNMQRWQASLTSGLTDTMLDMLFDLAGANIIGIIWFLDAKRDPQTFYRRRMASFLPAARRENLP